MKTTILTLVGISMFFLTHAQQSTHEVLSSAGGVNSATNISLEWTLGELSTGVFFSDGNMYTEGFHQPYLKVERMPEISIPFYPGESELQFQVFPNPVQSVLEIKVEDNDFQRKVQFILTDFQGKHLLQQEMDSSFELHKIDLSEFNSGVYVLLCVRKDGTLLKSFKVIKTN